MRRHILTLAFCAIALLTTCVGAFAQSGEDLVDASSRGGVGARGLFSGDLDGLFSFSEFAPFDDEEAAFFKRLRSAFSRRGTITGAPLGESAIFRGQISPPVVSPSSSYATPSYNPTPSNSAGYTPDSAVNPPTLSGGDPAAGYTYDQATSGAVQPPATMDDPTTIKRIFKYQQDASLDATYIPRVSGGLGVAEITGGLFFAIPCETLQGAKVNQGAFRLTPRFTYTNLDLPKEAKIGLDLPDHLFDAGLQTSFSVQTGDFQGNIEVQVGIASEFKKVNSDSFYIRGRAEGALPIDDARKTHILGGVSYYDRLKYKLLPVAGLIWKPNNENEFRLVFPDPMWGHFLGKANETDWWFFVRGDLGGGKWLLTDPARPVGGKRTYNFDYDDYRLSMGLRFDCPKGMVGSFEFGGAFGREIRTKAGTVYEPKNSVLLKAGVFF